ncbi:uncharacterized protein LOC131650169 [Vicia villosa]|uniref:uncharacterized protein LOC131650169 n=1 Tax=Vicia villosa TaxID=3911 RepID=UPI00273A77E8|nr:uncharacterized protein LOC131650169 [Vicia villosa]
MAGKNDAVIAAALEAMTQALENQPNGGVNAASCSLATFQRENPHVFKGTHDPDGTLTWLKKIERIFCVMDSTPGQKVRKYFPEDACGKKEIELLNLRQGNKFFVEYAAKFCELAKFYQHCDGASGEFSKCIKFEDGLRPEIKKGKSQQGRGKPYESPSGKGKQKVSDGKRSSGGDAPAGIVCFKCGKVGHKSIVCTAGTKRCFRCGKIGHEAPECKHKEMVCFNCGEEGHIGSKCQKPKKEKSSGKIGSCVVCYGLRDGR